MTRSSPQTRGLLSLSPALVIALVIGFILAGGFVGITRYTGEFRGDVTVTISSPDGLWSFRAVSDYESETTRVAVRKRGASPWAIVYDGPAASAAWSGRHQLVVTEQPTATRHSMDPAAASADPIDVRPSLGWVIPSAVGLFLVCAAIGVWVGWLARRPQRPPLREPLLQPAQGPPAPPAAHDQPTASEPADPPPQQ